MRNAGALVLLFAVVLVASFLPWATHAAGLEIGDFRLTLEHRDLDAWHTAVEVGSVRVEAWLAVVLAGVAAALALVGGRGRVRIPRVAAASLTGAALAVAATVAIVVADRGGTIRYGLLAALAALAAATLVALRSGSAGAASSAR